MTSAVSTSPAPPRGGRDLKSAVLVGVGLLATALVGLFWLDWLLVLLVVALLVGAVSEICLLYTSPSPRDQRGSRMPSSA